MVHAVIRYDDSQSQFQGIKAMGLKNDQFYMAMAMELAQKAADEGETPVGAVIVRNDGFFAGTGRNRREKNRNAL